MTTEGTDSLVIVQERSVYRIYWHIAETQDYGANLGDFGRATASLLKKAKGESWEHYAATWAAQDSEGVERDSEGLYWTEKVHASKALHAANVILKAGKVGKDKPWPEWTAKALAAGWKAPKGWKP